MFLPIRNPQFGNSRGPFNPANHVESPVVATIRRYLAALSPRGIHASRAALFGSFARGETRAYSAIDLVVIAPEFDGPREINPVKQRWLATGTDGRIAPIPCRERE